MTESPPADQDPGQSIGHGPAELRAGKAVQRLLGPPFAGAPRQQPGDRFVSPHEASGAGAPRTSWNTASNPPEFSILVVRK